jgi:predicted AlkP superfamily pyrophosphatase or phosphodiesterase
MSESELVFSPRRYSEVYLPDYSGNSLYNLSKSVVSRFARTSSGGMNSFSDLLKHDKVVVLLVDGLGYMQLMAARSRVPTVESVLKKSTEIRQATTVFPSTTSTVLSTLNAAQTPAEHGIIGYTMYVRELGSVVNTISFSPAAERGDGAFERAGLPPSYLYPQRTIYQELALGGTHSRVIAPDYLAGTVLSKTLYNGAERIKYSQMSDLFVSLRKVILDESHDEEFIFAYWSGIDKVSHRYGPSTEEYDGEMNVLFHGLLTELLDRIAGTDACVIVTADHGHMYIPQGSFHDISGDAELLSTMSVPPTGDSRALFLHARDPEAMDNLSRSRFSETSVIVESEKAVSEGFFGSTTLSPALRNRLGERIVLPYKAHSYVYRYPTFDPRIMYGNHGGLSLDELLVPLIVLESS